MMWNKREMDTKTGVYVVHCTANAGNVIIGAMRNSVQPCEWAGRYFMNGGGHVIAAPPKADISHWLSTRTQEISPLKQYRFQSPEMGATSTENGSYAEHELDLRVCVMRPCVRDALYKRFFYEWRLWYVNESDWEKKWHLELFSVDVAAIDPKRLFVEGNRT